MPSGGNFSSCTCGPDASACESPTQPVATVGLCLADGSPIAATVVRDCAGTVTSEGWIDLTTGVWSAGAPPAGTIACGDSRSIQVSGTFCDIDDDGQVLGLVLIEYSYAADGSIAGVRLVDAVTGDTYTPQGTVTTCPAGVEQPERDALQLCDINDDESGTVTSTPFLRDFARDETGAIVGHSDYTLDGEPYTVTGTVGVCPDAEAEPCASTVTLLRLCDLNPNVPPDEDGKRCAVPFLRHLVHDCTGALVETRDTAMDGVTPYTSVEAVDCGSGGVPAMVEVPWEVVDIQPDPASPAGRGFIFSLSPIDDPSTVGTVTVTTSATANTACPGTPPQYNFRNPCTYTFTPDQALRDAATYVRCDLLDFDSFEPVTSLTPPPSRLGGTAYWDGSTVRPTVSNGTGEMYYDNPPASWSYRVGNTGGGNSCSSLSFAAVSLRPEGCCAGCGGSGGEGSGRTVQEVCVIATAAPTVVMRWTRVIEDGGATIYYLDETGARYDGTLPAGHQIVDCPAVQPEPCRNASAVVLCDVLPEESPGEGGVPVVEFVRTFLTDCVTGAVVAVSDTDLDGQPYTTVGQVLQCESGTPAEECSTCETITLCDVQPEDESPGAPLINFTELRLSELEDGPTSGTLPNGVTFTVSCGDWLEPQGHYTIYPVGGNGSPACDQVWTFDQPVYVRFGVRGFNVSPRECIAYEAPGSTFTVEFLHPNHRLGSDPDSICGLGSATDESIVRTDSPVTELTIRAVTNFGAGRGLGLLHVGLLADPQPEPGSSTPFLRTVCRDCTGAVTSTTDTTLDGQPYTPAGTVTVCDSNGGGSTEPCRDVSSTLLCDVSALETVTVLDTVGVQDDDGWAITSFTNGGCASVNAPDGPVPGPAVWSAGYLGVRSDRSLGTGCQPWTGYDTATVRWVLTKTFTAAEDGTAVVTADTFLADGGARVRVNGQDVGIYAQWNQPAVGGSSQVPVTAGPNVIEIEVRDNAGPNWLRGRLDIVMTRTTQFLRKQVTDCETGAVISVTDTTLDGEPYEVTGEVGQCQTVSECCEQATPELRVDVESDVMCIRDAGGEITGQVVVERVYDDQSGDRVVQRLTDPTTGDEVTLPDGAELVLCQEPPCPTAFSTECVGIVERSEASYDNTSLIGGVPGQCGGVQGPGGQFPCEPTTGGLTITSWIVNGEEVIGDGGRLFAGGPCGAPGMHANWANALTNLDPSGATWAAQNQPGCAWFVGSTGGTQTVYGPMVVEDVDGREWTLTPAQSCQETPFTKVYSQECDGTVSVSWLDADGVATDAPEGQQVPCGTGCGAGGGRGLDVEPVTLCDVQEDGTAVPFLRHITYGSAGQVSVVIDTGLDGFAPYTPTGTVSRCQDDREPGVDIETLRMCVIDNATGNPLQEILAELRYDTETGERIGVTYVDPLTWGPVAIPGGAHFGLCPEQGPAPDVELLSLCDVTEDGTSTPFLRHLIYQPGATAPTVLDTLLDGATPYTPAGEVDTCGPTPAEECPSRNTLSACRWDDTDNDGIADTEYVELLAVDCAGALTSVGTYLPDLSGPYTPTNPVDGSTADPGPEPVVNVQAHRREIAPGGSWNAAAVPALRSVTFTAHGGTGTITTADGTSTLHMGEAVTWSLDKDADAALVGPLSVTADTGTVSVTWTATA